MLSLSASASMLQVYTKALPRCSSNGCRVSTGMRQSRRTMLDRVVRSLREGLGRDVLIAAGVFFGNSFRQRYRTGVASLMRQRSNPIESHFSAQGALDKDGFKSERHRLYVCGAGLAPRGVRSDGVTVARCGFPRICIPDASFPYQNQIPAQRYCVGPAVSRTGNYAVRKGVGSLRNLCKGLGRGTAPRKASSVTRHQY